MVKYYQSGYHKHYVCLFRDPEYTGPIDIDQTRKVVESIIEPANCDVYLVYMNVGNITHVISYSSEPQKSRPTMRYYETIYNSSIFAFDVPYMLTINAEDAWSPVDVTETALHEVILPLSVKIQGVFYITTA